MIYLLICTILLLVILCYIYFDKNLNDISKKILLKSGLDDNIKMCKEILKMLGNTHTQVEYNKEENSNLSYYNHSKDIVIMKKKEDNLRVINIAHECIHTIQKKRFLAANKFFSNLQMIYFLFSLIFIILSEKFEMELIFIQLLILLGTLFVKVVIEGDASYRSVSLAEKYLKTKIENQEAEEYALQCGQIIYDTMAIYYINFLLQGMFMIITNIILAFIF